MMSGSREFDVKTDSLGNIILIKKAAPKMLAENEQIFFMVESMPEYPGGEIELRKFIANNIVYPDVAQKEGIQGKVYVTFVVDREGNVANTKIARGVAPSLDQEALRVVNSLPAWKPGKQKGEAVNVSYTVPINFSLQ
jgi:TonB family protein